MGNGNDLGVLVVLEGDSIVVTIPGTIYSVTYHKLRNPPWLFAAEIRNDLNSSIDKFTFRARAWATAKEKARELGWLA
jgi:hypothetical protein